MKKFALVLAMVSLLSVLLCGCGKFTCDICREEKTGKRYEDEKFGVEVVICKDCKEDLDDLKDLFD
jgi:uncharacterized lipoprotein YehR (DUF1307 family)